MSEQKNETVSFEEAMGELEQIVEKLEQGDVALDLKDLARKITAKVYESN